jgi:hypothetical protein
LGISIRYGGKWLAIKGLKSEFLTLAQVCQRSLREVGQDELTVPSTTPVFKFGEQYVVFSRVLVILHSGLALAIDGWKCRLESENRTVLSCVPSKVAVFACHLLADN